MANAALTTFARKALCERKPGPFASKALVS